MPAGWLLFNPKEDGTVDVQLNLNNLSHCMQAFNFITTEIEKRHGADRLRQMIIHRPILNRRYVNEQRNDDLLWDLIQSEKTLEKFAENLAAENRELAQIAKENEKLATELRRRGEDPAIPEQAARTAKLKREKRGPGGATAAATIARHLRRLKAEKDAKMADAWGKMELLQKGIKAFERAKHRRTTST